MYLDTKNSKKKEYLFKKLIIKKGIKTADESSRITNHGNLYC